MLNKEGIDKLEAIMLANGKYFYNQRVWASKTDCGTQLCAAGFSLLIEMGDGAFLYALDSSSKSSFARLCIEAGKKLLGVTTFSQLPQIFDAVSQWPEDLARAYDAADAKGQIAVYINMLRTRTNDNGTINELED